MPAKLSGACHRVLAFNLTGVDAASLEMFSLRQSRRLLARLAIFRVKMENGSFGNCADWDLFDLMMVDAFNCNG